jgi:hypothetical protein
MDWTLFRKLRCESEIVLYWFALGLCCLKYPRLTCGFPIVRRPSGDSSAPKAQTCMNNGTLHDHCTDNRKVLLHVLQTRCLGL